MWTVVNDVEEDYFKKRREEEMQLFKEKVCPVADEDKVFCNSEDLSKAFWKVMPMKVDVG